LLPQAVTPVPRIDGSNEAARKANLALLLEADATYLGLRDCVTEIRRRVADADRQLAVAREQSRMYRLQLALAVPEGIRELVA